MRIIKENTIGLLVDVQERLLPVIHGKDQLTRNLNILLEGLKILEVPLLTTEQYTRGLGFTVEPFRSKLNHDLVFEKICFSCVKEDQVKEALNKYEKRFVLIAGIEAHICVLQTVIDLLEEDFVPVLLKDCVASRSPHNKQIAIDRMRQEGAIISGYESVLFEMTGEAGTNAFKQIAKLIK
jgi:hypothetical protein